MNSYQWISDFNGGLAILNSLQQDNYSKDLQLYYPRFQIQKYEFEEALKSLEKLENSSGTLLYKLNAYGHLGKDQDAIKLLNETMNSVEKDDFYYIILRNSAHYFPTKEATKNLELALDYFQRNEYQIPVATVYNNLGVVNIWDGQYDIALENINKAEKILKKYDSNEIFEPYCNKSIIFLMNKNYQQSLEFINKSLQECTKALTLDIRMLKLNKLIIELISEKISFTEFQNSLKSFEAEIPLIDDPWYKFQIVYNLQQFEDIPFVYEKTYIDDYQDGLTKYYLLIPYKKYNFCIGLSPNWRY
ncbi:Tetratricopeptide repeat [Streptococcus suis]|uniref:tetratricopeptide repeat protein n=1 Tax=Streptococcus suis TaxID=1307 RepID=UPI0007693071|nr:tetratricopeptide repeat protein [Streptococcus suis]CYU41310.1 Tetratricopeptide repeat [Streptococcus suis]CYW16754.1 Tetratricopeptide repeat [Streptococcus suis]CYW77488.1 Tetratricopeptide repeat [Streptococcus suis]CYX07212.1 Tetratricopeptide repeat [Streptococcus suis]